MCIIKVLYNNVRSLTCGTIREELQVLIKSENIDVVGLTETWGKSAQIPLMIKKVVE